MRACPMISTQTGEERWSAAALRPSLVRTLLGHSGGGVRAVVALSTHQSADLSGCLRFTRGLLASGGRDGTNYAMPA